MPGPVRLALTVLGRRDTQYDKGTRVDLRGTCLRTAELTGAALSAVDLRQADYDGTTEITGVRVDGRTVGKWW